jgi:hypothetical protein
LEFSLGGQRYARPVPFRFVLLLEDGEPADPPVFLTATRDWHEGDVFMPRGGESFRIVRIEPAMYDEAPFHAKWTVEPLLG